MKNTWTAEKAFNYVEDVKAGIAPRGLKFCSASDYLRNHVSTAELLALQTARDEKRMSSTKKKHHPGNKKHRPPSGKLATA